MLYRILWLKMRRNKLMILFLVLACIGIWLFNDYDSWLTSTCWTENCRRLRQQQNGDEDIDDIDDPLAERGESTFLKRNSEEKNRNASTMCTLPKLDPFEPSIRHLITDFGEDPNCKGPDLHFTINSRGSLTLRKKQYRSALKIRSAKLKYIIRPEDNDDSYYLGPDLYPFKRAANKKIRKITSDFVKLIYEPKDSEEELIHYMAKVTAKRDVLQRSHKSLFTNPAGIPLNVLIFGFDSTSNVMFQRKLPKTYKYLKDHLDAYFFNGYSAIGDGTTPILTALLTGKFVSELVKNKSSRTDSDLNLWPWIMKDYARHGYVSLYAEDDQKIAAFNIRMNGFRKPPADHYMRPFWLALEDHKLRREKRRKKFPDNNLACLGSEALHNITLDYLYSLFDAYPKIPKFGFAFLSYLSHGIPDKLSYADNDVLRYLKRYEKMQNNTILILLSDHGARIGPLRNSMQGSLEERLPWLSIVLPKWFSTKYPNMAANMRQNQDVITSAFDVHATLQHLISYPKNPKSQKTKSLLTKIDPLRSCAEAGVDYHYCPCIKWKPISVDLPEVKLSAKAIVQKINDNIAKNEFTMTRCAPIVLVSVISAAEVEATSIVASPIKHGRIRRRKTPIGRRLQVIIETSPLKGMFEATIMVRGKGHVVVSPHISRTSVYGNNPHCVVDHYPELRKFCVCYNKIETQDR